MGPHLFSRTAVEHLLTHRYSTVLWNVVPGDWRDPQGWPKACHAQITAQAWSLVVLHDLANGCLAHLPTLLTRLIDEGVQFEQDFPPEMILTDAGRITGLHDGLVAGGIAGLSSLPGSA